VARNIASAPRATNAPRKSADLSKEPVGRRDGTRVQSVPEGPVGSCYGIVARV
jgi:hypothetical protein